MYKHPRYPLLFSPLKINRLILKNRIFYAPVEAYHDRALSGCAVMMRGTSGTLNDPRCRISPGKWLFADAVETRRVKEELTTLRRGGALTSLEIMHAGLHAGVPEGENVIGPCDGIRKDGVVIKGMDQRMIDFVIDKFVETAFIAKKIGYDMVMLHFAHGWLPSQFLAPSINKRTDEYGGSVENRFRFPKMILKAVRKALGPDYPIDMRISAYENFDGCAPTEEVIRFIKEVSEEKLIDLVNVSYGGFSSADSSYASGPFSPDMCYAKYSKTIKDAVKIPVVVVGKIMTPEHAEQILAEGKADAVVIGRASIADPWWAKKAFECRPEDIVPCILCGKCFDKRCPVQLRNYNENWIPLKLKKSLSPKKVVVVGGGPAGMKAAIIACEKGHETVLFEASSELGGLTKAADHDENKRELKRYKDYLVMQLGKSNAKVILNTKATPEIIEAERPDQLILAMGSVPVTPNIKGVGFVHQVIDIYPHKDKIGKNTVIIGGGLVGSEFAATLALRGHNVTVVEKEGAIGGQFDDTIFRPYYLLKSLPNTVLMSNTNCIEIKEDAVIVENNEYGRQELKADTVILAAGFRSNNDNIDRYYGITPHTTMIGDLRRPATIRECEEEGYFATAEI
jgi:2,4-dienoyl-CoA reductase-like NADH-dependent reductase (Old Yellow Enzyme family)/thioredoxin reductase